MMKRTLTIGAILLLVVTLAVPALARGTGRWGGGGGYGPGACWRDGGPYGASALSAEERAKVDELYRNHHEQTAPLRERLWAKRAEMRALLAAETVDEARVKEVQKEINGLRTDLSDKRIEVELALGKMDPKLRFAGRDGRGGYGQPGYGKGCGRHPKSGYKHPGYGQGAGPHMRGGYGPGSGACW